MFYIFTSNSIVTGWQYLDRLFSVVACDLDCRCIYHNIVFIKNNNNKKEYRLSPPGMVVITFHACIQD